MLQRRELAGVVALELFRQWYLSMKSVLQMAESSSHCQNSPHGREEIERKLIAPLLAHAIDDLAGTTERQVMSSIGQASIYRSPPVPSARNDQYSCI